MAFTEYTSPGYQKKQFHEEIAADLTDMVFGDLRRLMVFMPPRHGKTELCSRKFPAFIHGNQPDANIIAATHSRNLASRVSRQVQRVVTSPECQRVFPKLKLASMESTKSRASQNANMFEVVGHDGVYQSFSVGQGSAGAGGHYVILDDPYRNRQAAMSPKIRQAILDWFTGDLYSRLMPDARIVIIFTRWHPEDLGGFLEELQKTDSTADQYRIRRYPAINSNGEALWPERYPIEHLRRVEKQDVRIFNACYNQDPRALIGNLFQSDWFQYCDAHTVPDGVRWVRYWDIAGAAEKDGNDPDFTAGAKVGIANGHTWIADIAYLRGTPLEVRQVMRNTAIRDGIEVTQVVEQEPGAASIHFLNNLKGTVFAGFKMRTDKAVANKVLRAEVLSSQFESGNVSIVRGHWNHEFHNQAIMFPTGTHDDLIDAPVGGYNWLTKKRVLAF